MFILQHLDGRTRSVTQHPALTQPSLAGCQWLIQATERCQSPSHVATAQMLPAHSSSLPPRNKPKRWRVTSKGQGSSSLSQHAAQIPPTDQAATTAGHPQDSPTTAPQPEHGFEKKKCTSRKRRLQDKRQKASTLHWSSPTSSSTLAKRTHQPLTSISPSAPSETLTHLTAKSAQTHSLQTGTVPGASLCSQTPTLLVSALAEFGTESALEENCCHVDSPVVSFSPLGC